MNLLHFSVFFYFHKDEKVSLDFYLYICLNFKITAVDPCTMKSHWTLDRHWEPGQFFEVMVKNHQRCQWVTCGVCAIQTGDNNRAPSSSFLDPGLGTNRGSWVAKQLGSLHVNLTNLFLTTDPTSREIREEALTESPIRKHTCIPPPLKFGIDDWELKLPPVDLILGHWGQVFWVQI